MSTPISKSVKSFDKNGTIKREIDDALRLLKRFREKYTFRENPESIEALTPDALFKEESSEVGDFFWWIEFRLKPLGHLFTYSNVYRKARRQLEDFKALLHFVVDESRSLADKVDAPWDKISGMGGDRHIAKKIIFCFNYGTMPILPIFKTSDLEYFHNCLVGKLKLPSDYDNMTLGEKYQILTRALLDVKDSLTDTKSWTTPYFTRFLYDMYSPPRPPPTSEGTGLETKPLSEWGLLFEPHSHDEVMFLFSKMHSRIGFPYITRIQKEYPDVYAIDNDRRIKRIEIETYASQFEGHDSKGCDYIVCWENDLESKPEDWPEIIQLKDFLS